MSFYQTSDFFSLEEYEHKKVFANPVWESLSCLKDYMMNFPHFGIKTTIPSGCFLENEQFISIGSDSIIEPGTFIRGPFIAGKGTEIRFGAYIRGFVLCGDFCVLGHTTEVKHSILLNEVKAAHFAYIGDSILGSRVNLGAGVKCANLRLDQGVISIREGTNKKETGKKKLGAILADDVQVGCNTVLNPGTMMGKKGKIPPLTSMSGVHGHI